MDIILSKPCYCGKRLWYEEGTLCGLAFQYTLSIRTCIDKFSAWTDEQTTACQRYHQTILDLASAGF